MNLPTVNIIPRSLSFLALALVPVVECVEVMRLVLVLLLIASDAITGDEEGLTCFLWSLVPLSEVTDG